MEWWLWPLLLFAATFVIGVIAVLAGVGGGVLFVPIVGAVFPFHLDFVRAAGLMVALTSALSAAPSLLAKLNVTLNASAGLFLLAGFACVRSGNITWHRRCMLSAFALSTLFLVSYVLHHAQVGSVPFRGQGILRPIYFSILIPHIVLAGVIVPLALFTRTE